MSVKINLLIFFYMILDSDRRSHRDLGQPSQPPLRLSIMSVYEFTINIELFNLMGYLAVYFYYWLRKGILKYNSIASALTDLLMEALILVLLFLVVFCICSIIGKLMFGLAHGYFVRRQVRTKVAHV